MDKKGYEKLEGVLSDRAEVETTVPEDGEDFHFVHLRSEATPAQVMNRLGEAMLTGVQANRPNFELVSQSSILTQRGTIFYLTLEDISHPLSTRRLGFR